MLLHSRNNARNALTRLCRSAACVRCHLNTCFAFRSNRYGNGFPRNCYEHSR